MIVAILTKNSYSFIVTNRNKNLIL